MLLIGKSLNTEHHVPPTSSPDHVACLTFSLQRHSSLLAGSCTQVCSAARSCTSCGKPLRSWFRQQICPFVMFLAQNPDRGSHLPDITGMTGTVSTLQLTLRPIVKDIPLRAAQMWITCGSHVGHGALMGVAAKSCTYRPLLCTTISH